MKMRFKGLMMSVVSAAVILVSCQKEDDSTKPLSKPDNIDGLWVMSCEDDAETVPHLEIKGTSGTWCDADVSEYDFSSWKSIDVSYNGGKGTFKVDGGKNYSFVCDAAGNIVTEDGEIFYKIDNTLMDLSTHYVPVDVPSFEEDAFVGPQTYHDLHIDNEYATSDNGKQMLEDSGSILWWLAKNIAEGIIKGGGSAAARSFYNSIFESEESKKLDQVISTLNEMNAKLSYLETLFVNTTCEAALNKRTDEYVIPMMTYTGMYYEMLKLCKTDDEIAQAVTSWATSKTIQGNDPLVEYQNFIGMLTEDVFLQKNIYQIYDLYVFNTHPFEYCGYPIREGLRACDLAVICENAYMAMLYNMIRTDVNEAQRQMLQNQIAQYIGYYQKFANDNPVVRHDGYIVCQIDGAHFVMKNTLKKINYYTRSWYPDGSAWGEWEESTDRIVYGDETMSYNQVKEQCFTAEEASGIMLYYYDINKKSPYDCLLHALMEEAGLQVSDMIGGHDSMIITQVGSTHAEKDWQNRKYYIEPKATIMLCQPLDHRMQGIMPNIGVMKFDQTDWMGHWKIVNWDEYFGIDGGVVTEDDYLFFRPVDLTRYDKNPDE